MPALATVPTPLGPFTALVDDEGAVLASGWTDDADALLALVHAELRPADPARRAELGDVTAAVAAFHDGDPAPGGGDSRAADRAGRPPSAIWDRLRARCRPARRPPTASSPRPRATRAVTGSPPAACVHNAATLFVPCHRVLRRGGALGGYRWGLELKERLLALEASWRVDDRGVVGV